MCRPSDPPWKVIKVLSLETSLPASSATSAAPVIPLHFGGASTSTSLSTTFTTSTVLVSPSSVIIFSSTTTFSWTTTFSTSTSLITSFSTGTSLITSTTSVSPPQAIVAKVKVSNVARTTVYLR